MEVVKAGMGHGDLSMEAYSQVWEECYGQVRIATSYRISSNQPQFLAAVIHVSPSFLRCCISLVKTGTPERI